MNDEFPLIVIVRYQTCSILMLSVVSTLHHAPLFMDRIWLLLVPVETEVDLPTANKLSSDSTPNEQVKMGVCGINFDGSPVNVTLFSSRFFCFWKECGKNCECHPAHWFLFINILGRYMLLFHQSTMRIIYSGNRSITAHSGIAKPALINGCSFIRWELFAIKIGCHSHQGIGSQPFLELAPLSQKWNGVRTPSF